jgi:hypothetical protein
VGDDHLRIVDFLSLPDEPIRTALRERLQSKATCISSELGKVPLMTDLREALADSFVETFAKLPLGELKVELES